MIAKRRATAGHASAETRACGRRGRPVGGSEPCGLDGGAGTCGVDDTPASSLAVETDSRNHWTE